VRDRRRGERGRQETEIDINYDGEGCSEMEKGQV